MSEEVGKEIGIKLGKVIEVDKQSRQDNQAKFMRIRVELCIEKPLRRGGHIANGDGERFGTSFPNNVIMLSILLVARFRKIKEK